MKKVLALLAAFTFVFGLSVSAFAVVNENTTPTTSVTFKKALTINNSGTINPDEIFEFEILEGNRTIPGENDLDAPDFDTDPNVAGNQNTFSITIESTLGPDVVLGSKTIDLPTFTGVGVYTYPVKEILGDTAGMNYDAKIYYLEVTVINNPSTETDAPPFLSYVTMYRAKVESDGMPILGEDGKPIMIKDDTFDNDFDAGDLVIEKLVTGNFGSPDDVFEVTVTITPGDEKILKMGPMTFDGSSSYSQDPITGIITVVYEGVQKGDSFTIGNIPYDVSYVVEETVDGTSLGYLAPVYTNKSGAFAVPAKTATITNERNVLPQTGVNLDSLPYILLLSGAVIGMSALFIRKRQNASF